MSGIFNLFEQWLISIEGEEILPNDRCLLCKRKPEFTFLAYYNRIVKYIPMDVHCLFFAVIYFMKFIYRTKSYKLCNDPYRLFAICIVLANKYISDFQPKLSFYSTIFGLSKTDIFYGELYVLNNLDFNCFITENDVVTTSKLLIIDRADLFLPTQPKKLRNKKSHQNKCHDIQ